jgi:hypothetical protein
MFLSTSESSIIGAIMSKIGMQLFGESYRWIFSPIMITLGVMILVKKASWSISRLVGIILFFLSSASFVGWYNKATVGYFDIYSMLDHLM